MNAASHPMTDNADMTSVLEKISKQFGSHTVLDGVSLSLAENGITCLLGPSGCGKSTLLRIAASLLPADGGSVHIDPREAAMVFQEPRLLPWLTVEENLSLAIQNASPADRAAGIRDVLSLVELGDIAQLLPRELSGGMAQRVGLARALLRRPRFLLMDEPFAALDAITRAALQKMLVALIAEQRVTCLFVTHDINEALLIANHIYVTKNGTIMLDCASTPELASTVPDESARCARENVRERILSYLQKT
ncbi:ABC transporter ATP-binding protein [Desulfovibrio sp. OttesenSCG-928-I05]|nr:ABC transporter ATP-binding protein [Desulfovibrio sp. OttesenSCG-928-I05]